MVDKITDADSALQVMNDILALEHASTSKKECSKMVKDKAASIGLKYSLAVKKFIEISKSKEG